MSDPTPREGAPGRARYVRVAVNAGRPSRSTFTYRVPVGREVHAGEVVHVPWGARTLQGVITEGPTDLPGYAGDTRELEPPVDGAPRIQQLWLDLAAWIADEYLAPVWESHALMLPPGAGERPLTAIARAPDAPPEPTALSGRQAALYAHLTPEPVELDDVRAAVGSRGFDAALAALVRRGLVERRYRLERPRGRPRVVEIVRLMVSPDQALAAAAAVEGRRASRRGRAIRALLAAGGPLPFDVVAREARGAPAVETLLDEGVLVREGPASELVRLAVPEPEAQQRLRVLSRNQAQQAAAGLLERLAGAEEHSLPVAGLPAIFGAAARPAVRLLFESGLVRIEEVLDRRDPLRTLQVVRRPAVELTPDQRRAAAALHAAIDRAQAVAPEAAAPAILLHGVTGSGKTEVYLDALEYAVRRGRRGLVLVPEIALTAQTVRRFAERFPGRVGVLHSGLNLGEAYDEWHAIAQGAYDVVVGSRSALFAPQPDLGVIIIDEAHEWTYKQTDRAPRYDARDAAARLATLTGAAVIFGTATPDAERWYAAATDRIERVDLPRRVRAVRQPDGETRLWPSEALPDVEVVDVRGVRSLFSPPLVEALAGVLDRDEQAILFINRRGLAGHLICAAGHAPMCGSCDVALAVHQVEGAAGVVEQRLICHLCHRTRRPPERCPECRRPLRPLRAGTQRVEQEVQSLFPAARVARWDRDTARSAEQHEAILGRFLRQEADVLVGTQMVAKGLDLPLVTLVGVILADYGLWTGDFRARERTFQLLEQVAGRAGRAERHGQVIVQTLQPDDAAIAHAAEHDVDGFFEAELPWRSDHGYPPFRRMARLLFGHRHATYAREEAERVGQQLRVRALVQPDLDVRGPTPPPVARVRGIYRQALHVFAPDPPAVLRDVELPPGWVIDIDPVTLG